METMQRVDDPHRLWSFLFDYRLGIYHLWKINKWSYFFTKANETRIRNCLLLFLPLSAPNREGKSSPTANKHNFFLIKCLLNDKDEISEYRKKSCKSCMRVLEVLEVHMYEAAITTTIRGARRWRETKKLMNEISLKHIFLRSFINERISFLFFTSSWNIKKCKTHTLWEEIKQPESLLWNKQWT